MLTLGKRLLSALGAILIAGVWPADIAMAQASCGDFYRVQRGDTLREITLKTLRHNRYRVLFQANRDVLPSPERLEVGQLIFVPCKGAAVQDRKTALAKAGRVPSSRDNLGDRVGTDDPADASVKVVTPSAPVTEQNSGVALPVQDAASSAQQRRPLRILTASGMSPLADHALPDGGLLPVLIREAFHAGGVKGANVAFVDDRNAHLSVLMPTGAFDLTFPWPGVDCAQPDRGPTARDLCRDFLMSRPVYEATVMTIVTSDSPLMAATSTDALQGKRLCRPMGFPPVDLEEMRLGATVVIARSAGACVELIKAGQVDGMSTPMDHAAGLTWPGLATASGLSWTVPVHALAWRQTPGSDRTIAALNDGLEKLQKSGRWFNIVSKYLRDVNAGGRLAGN